MSLSLTEVDKEDSLRVLVYGLIFVSLISRQRGLSQSTSLWSVFVSHIDVDKGNSLTCLVYVS